MNPLDAMATKTEKAFRIAFDALEAISKDTYIIDHPCHTGGPLPTEASKKAVEALAEIQKEFE